jgi:type I restriction enzyme S subunit
MSSEWRMLLLGDVYEYCSGLSKPRSEFGSGHPFLGFKDVFYNSAVPKVLNELVKSTQQEQNRCSIKRGDLFLTRTSETMDELGMSSVALKDYPNATFNGFTKRLRPKSSDVIAPEYARYYFRSTHFRQSVNAMSTMSTRASLNNEILDRLQVVLPPLKEQQCIGYLLATLDDKIELNRKTNETLEAMAKALFKSWFVDFDPVRAKAEGRTTGLPAEISDLFPDSFDDSELGEIPSGWRVGCLSDCCEITMGQSPPGDTYNEDGHGLPFYQGKTDFGFRFPGRRVYCSSPTRQAFIGATLISVRAPVGSANIAREVCSIGRGVAALKSRQSADSFIYYLIGTLQGVFESYNSEGTVFGAINGKDLASIQVVAPSTEATAAFNSQCLPMDESIQSNTLETEHLTTIRDTLLPKLISGEIRIPDAEKMLEAVGV